MKRFLVLLALALVGAGIVVSSAGALRFEEGDCRESGPGGIWVCPAGRVGTPYEAQLRGAGGCGPDLPYQYRVLSGALPPGVSLASSGRFSGTPTSAGVYQFYVELSDQDPPSQSWCRPGKSERQFSITINPSASEPQGPTLETASVPPATVGSSYSVSLTASPSGAYSWAVAEGALPPGLTLGQTSGVIAGTPTASGAFTFAVQATDSSNRTATRGYRIDVRQPLAVTPLAPQGEPGGLPSAEVGIPVEAKLAATGGTGAFTWTLAAGSLPAGIVLHSDGTLKGTPGAGGSFTFTVRVGDPERRSATADVALTVAARLVITTARLRAARVGRVFGRKIATAGGIEPLRWKIVNGILPPGVRFDRRLGVFTGKPKRKGTWRATVQAVDAVGATATKTFVLRVKP